MPATADAGSNLFAALARALGLTALIVGAGLVLMFAAAAALVVGVMILGAAAAMRLFPARRARAAGGPEVLDARRTPYGWVVETQTQRKS